MMRLALSVMLMTLAASLACDDHGVVVGDLQAIPRGGGGDAGGNADATAGSSGGDSAGGAGGQSQRTDDFILGADISWVQEQEDLGTVFVDDGVERDILELFKAHGFNYIRLRLFNNPASPCRTSVDGDETCGYQFEFGTRAEPYCDLEHTVQMARRVRAAGMGLLLNFHYSDTWADPDDQNKPEAWESLSFEELTAAVESFTEGALLELEQGGALPDMVQLGNEITPGMLFPDGSSSAPGNFGRFTTLLQAGIAGVKSVDPSIRIMLHIEKPDSFATSDWWLSNVLDNGVEFDILGQSCYPEWHGTPASWEATFDQLAEAYPDLQFLIAEYSREKRTVNDIMWNLPSARGLGTFIWEPTQWGETLFDQEGDQLVTNSLIDLYDQMAEDYGLR
jgi:arabinogalactan endo-1,4-beta-galactosidase